MNEWRKATGTRTNTVKVSCTTHATSQTTPQNKKTKHPQEPTAGPLVASVTRGLTPITVAQPFSKARLRQRARGTRGTRGTRVPGTGHCCVPQGEGRVFLFVLFL